MSFLKKLFKKQSISIGKTFVKSDVFYDMAKREVSEALSDNDNVELIRLSEELTFRIEMLDEERLWGLLLGDGHRLFLCKHIPLILRSRFGDALPLAENSSLVEFMMRSLVQMRDLSYEQVKFLKENLHIPTIKINESELFMDNNRLVEHVNKQKMASLEMDRKRDPETRGMDIDEIYNRKMLSFNLSHCLLKTL